MDGLTVVNLICPDCGSDKPHTVVDVADQDSVHVECGDLMCGATFTFTFGRDE